MATCFYRIYSDHDWFRLQKLCFGGPPLIVLELKTFHVHLHSFWPWLKIRIPMAHWSPVSGAWCAATPAMDNTRMQSIAWIVQSSCRWLRQNNKAWATTNETRLKMVTYVTYKVWEDRVKCSLLRGYEDVWSIYALHSLHRVYPYLWYSPE